MSDDEATKTEYLLEVVQSGAVRLLAGVPTPPSALRIHAADVTLELEWPTAAPVETVLKPVAPPAEIPPPVSPGDPREHLCAETVGVFYRAPEPGAAPFVEVGDVVQPGVQVAIVEAMKLMIPVTAARAGRVAEVLKHDGDPVEYGEPLFALEPA